VDAFIGSSGHARSPSVSSLLKPKPVCSAGFNKSGHHEAPKILGPADCMTDPNKATAF
jgi:hypothetical protein